MVVFAMKNFIWVCSNVFDTCWILYMCTVVNSLCKTFCRARSFDSNVALPCYFQIKTSWLVSKARVASIATIKVLESNAIAPASLHLSRRYLQTQRRSSRIALQADARSDYGFVWAIGISWLPGCRSGGLSRCAHMFGSPRCIFMNSACTVLPSKYQVRSSANGYS